MGGVWCKTDKVQRTHSSKQPFNNALTRWTDHVRQAYRRPKNHHRPPRPPQKPVRSNERLTISAPTLVSPAESDGWRTATLLVPEATVAPVPPPRKKRKRNVDLSRSAVSMDNLNLGSACLNKSTISLPETCSSDTPDFKSSSSTLVVTPILEPRSNEETDEDKENMKNLQNKIEDDEDCDQPEIIPIENETFFSSRTLLHSSLGYVDKLSAISEVSTESGFDDKTDNLKSEGSGSVTSMDSGSRETLNILAHIRDISTVSKVKENRVILPSTAETTSNNQKEEIRDVITPTIQHNKQSKQETDSTTITNKHDSENHCETNYSSVIVLDQIRNATDVNTKTVDEAKERGIREKTAVSKKEWLQNILMEDPEPYFIARDDTKDRRGSEGVTKLEAVDVSGPNSLPSHLSLTTQETDAAVGINKVSSPGNLPPGTNHSVLLDIIQQNKMTEGENDANFLNQREEAIFLTNTKTNIIYKSLSSDKLTEYVDCSEAPGTLNGRNSSEHNELSLTSKARLSDYSFQTPKLVESDSGLNSLLQDKRSNVVSSYDFKEIKSGNHYVTVQNLNSAESDANNINGVKSLQGSAKGSDVSNEKTVKETLAKKDSISSSRKSSLTDSLHEFEMSIYDMLNESKKNEQSSDEEEPLRTVK